MKYNNSHLGANEHGRVNSLFKIISSSKNSVKLNIILHDKYLINTCSYFTYLDCKATNTKQTQLHWIVLFKRFSKIILVPLRPIITEFMTT